MTAAIAHCHPALGHHVVVVVENCVANVVAHHCLLSKQQVSPDHLVSVVSLNLPAVMSRFLGSLVVFVACDFFGFVFAVVDPVVDYSHFVGCHDSRHFDWTFDHWIVVVAYYYYCCCWVIYLVPSSRFARLPYVYQRKIARHHSRHLVSHPMMRFRHCCFSFVQSFYFYFGFWILNSCAERLLLLALLHYSKILVSFQRTDEVHLCFLWNHQSWYSLRMVVPLEHACHPSFVN
mmetsp:Transcript_2439/g.5686  ORF Transcript_2439/g.5686 Transcript_2439/m.5686 type:complete len:233 (-) Transcript_2439:268-966(-)